MSTDEELIKEARNGYKGQGWVKDHHPHSAVGLAIRLADALEAATTRRIVTDAAEIEDLPERTVVTDKFGDVLQRRGSQWASHETAAFDSAYVARKWAPLTVVYTPEVESPAA